MCLAHVCIICPISESITVFFLPVEDYGHFQIIPLNDNLSIMYKIAITRHHTQGIRMMALHSFFLLNRGNKKF